MGIKPNSLNSTVDFPNFRLSKKTDLDNAYFEREDSALIFSSKSE